MHGINERLNFSVGTSSVLDVSEPMTWGLIRSMPGFRFDESRMLDIIHGHGFVPRWFENNFIEAGRCHRKTRFEWIDLDGVAHVTVVGK